MENSLTVSVSSWQLILSLLFQIWLIVFPILLIRKANYIITLLEDKFYPQEGSEG